MSLYAKYISNNLKAETAEKRIAAKVVHIHDGDTMRVRYDDGQVIKIRLYGVDSPEIGQDFGRESADMAKEFLLGHDVVVEGSPSKTGAGSRNQLKRACQI